MINISTNISWPSYDKNLIQEDNIKIVVQINGKKREIFEVKKNLSEEEVVKIIFENNKLNNQIFNKTIKRKIFVKDRLINFII